MQPTIYLLTVGTASLGATLQRAFLADLHALADTLRLPVEICHAPPTSSGPLIILTGDAPHVPLWRLRDALSHLRAGAELVVGPAEAGGWYLLAYGGLPRSLPLSDADPATLAAAIAGYGRHAVTLPPWYRLSAAVDLARLAAEVQHMPAQTIPCTRVALAETPLFAQEFGR